MGHDGRGPHDGCVRATGAGFNHPGGRHDGRRVASQAPSFSSSSVADQCSHWDPARTRELTAGVTHCGRERCDPFFSQTSSAAELQVRGPGERDHVVLAEHVRVSISSFSISPATPSSMSSSSNPSIRPSASLVTKTIEHPDEITVDEVAQRGGDVAVELVARELDDNVVDRAELIDRFAHAPNETEPQRRALSSFGTVTQWRHRPGCVSRSMPGRRVEPARGRRQLVRLPGRGSRADDFCEPGDTELVGQRLVERHDDELRSDSRQAGRVPP